MTLYIVRAKPKNDLSGLRKELESGKISKLRPFGEALHYGLQNARFDANNSYAMRVEELLFSTIGYGKGKCIGQIL